MNGFAWENGKLMLNLKIYHDYFPHQGIFSGYTLDFFPFIPK